MVNCINPSRPITASKRFDVVLATWCASTLFSKKEQGLGVWLAGEELIEGRLEKRVFGFNAGEQREAGAQFQVIRVAKDFQRTLVAVLQEGTYAFLQSWPQQIMQQIGPGFGSTRDGKAFGYLATPEAMQLREDEPHPVTGLVPGTQLFHGSGKNRALGLDETKKIEGVVHACTP